MKSQLIIYCMLLSATSFSQNTTEKSVDLSLQDRFVQMKGSSQTFQDYKVIKEVVLDGVWQIVQDSIKMKSLHLTKSILAAKQLEGELLTEKTKTEEMQSSVKDIVYASTHISFFGIDFKKSVFIGLVLMVIAGQLVLLLGFFGKLKLMYFSMREKVETSTQLSAEYEEYKKKSLEKQAKLSRELQTERNKQQIERNSMFTIRPLNSNQSIL